MLLLASIATNNNFIPLNDNFRTISIDNKDFIESNIKDIESDLEVRISITINY